MSPTLYKNINLLHFNMKQSETIHMILPVVQGDSNEWSNVLRGAKVIIIKKYRSIERPPCTEILSAAYCRMLVLLTDVYHLLFTFCTSLRLPILFRSVVIHSVLGAGMKFLRFRLIDRILDDGVPVIQRHKYY